MAILLLSITPMAESRNEKFLSLVYLHLENL